MQTDVVECREWCCGVHLTPAQEPVLYRGEPSYVADDGRVAAFEAVGV